MASRSKRFFFFTSRVDLHTYARDLMMVEHTATYCARMDAQGWMDGLCPKGCCVLATPPKMSVESIFAFLQPLFLQPSLSTSKMTTAVDFPYSVNDGKLS